MVWLFIKVFTENTGEISMRLIHKHTNEAVANLTEPVIYERAAARGIIMDGEDILLIYTKRYNDYSFPGGGVDSGEDLMQGLMRELAEETGAKNIEVKSAFGAYEEYRPSHYKGYDMVHMLSYFYVCTADRELGEAQPEDYELKNGSEPVWVNIHEAIRHNQKVMADKEDSMGLSIDRETRVLRLVVEEIL